MQKVSYMGNGETTEFAFNFPYFENSNIIVTKNGTTATGYEIIGNPGGLDADIPYIGGRVVFEIAPTALDNITIARSLPLSRVTDYQPLEKISPTTLNQDMNYMMEILKDLQDEFETLQTQYSEIANKESTAVLLAKMQEIHNEITAVSAQIAALGDVSQIRNDITTLNTRTTGMLDYVIESQTPTAENNYTWFRKYKSGWVEQGGIWTGSWVVGNGTSGTKTINIPVAMNDTHYTVVVEMCKGDSTGGDQMWSFHETQGLTTTSFSVVVGGYNNSRTITRFVWQLSGVAA